MKFSEIKLSKIFSLIILIIVVGVFLLPVLSMNFMFWLADRKEQRFESSLDEDIEFQTTMVKHSIAQLNVKDLALLECISEQALDRAKLPPNSSGSIENVDQLKWLNCSGSNIINLEGIGGLRRLVFLGLANNKITNIKELEKLEKLEDVNLSYNTVVDLGPLSGLPQLKRLDISGNQPDSIKPLLTIGSLQELDMPDTAKIYCADVEVFLNVAAFSVKQNSHSENCKGTYSSEMGRILALKNAGSTLSPDDEILLLEYELNKMRTEYQKKYQ